MNWRAVLASDGWRLMAGERGRGSWANCSPDRHGRITRVQSSADVRPLLTTLQLACEEARALMPPRPQGVFYGPRCSLIRQEFCELVVATLNRGEGV